MSARLADLRAMLEGVVSAGLNVSDAEFHALRRCALVLAGDLAGPRKVLAFVMSAYFQRLAERADASPPPPGVLQSLTDTTADLRLAIDRLDDASTEAVREVTDRILERVVPTIARHS